MLIIIVSYEISLFIQVHLVKKSLSGYFYLIFFYSHCKYSLSTGAGLVSYFVLNGCFTEWIVKLYRGLFKTYQIRNIAKLHLQFNIKYPHLISQSFSIKQKLIFFFWYKKQSVPKFGPEWEELNQDPNFLLRFWRLKINIGTG